MPQGVVFSRELCASISSLCLSCFEVLQSGASIANNLSLGVSVDSFHCASPFICRPLVQVVIHFRQDVWTDGRNDLFYHLFFFFFSSAEGRSGRFNWQSESEWEFSVTRNESLCKHVHERKTGRVWMSGVKYRMLSWAGERNGEW